MIKNLALIEQHLNETSGPWKKSARSAGEKMYGLNRNGPVAIKIATTHLNAFAHAISQKPSVGSRPLEESSPRRSVQISANADRSSNTMNQSESTTPTVIITRKSGSQTRNQLNQSESSGPAVAIMKTVAIKRTRGSPAKKSPDKSSKSKLSSMRSPFHGSKRKKVPDPLANNAKI